MSGEAGRGWERRAAHAAADSEARLEGIVRRAFCDLPPRRAPPSLEARVMHAIARRATLPWWRRRFAEWPRLARVAFGLICAAIAAASLAARAYTDLRPIAALWAPWSRHLLALLHAAASVDDALVRMVPGDWLYAGALLYAVLFGLAAAAYRILYLDSPLASGMSS